MSSDWPLVGKCSRSKAKARYLLDEDSVGESHAKGGQIERKLGVIQSSKEPKQLAFFRKLRTERQPSTESETGRVISMEDRSMVIQLCQRRWSLWLMRILA